MSMILRFLALSSVVFFFSAAPVHASCTDSDFKLYKKVKYDCALAVGDYMSNGGENPQQCAQRVMGSVTGDYMKASDCYSRMMFKK